MYHNFGKNFIKKEIIETRDMNVCTNDKTLSFNGFDSYYDLNKNNYINNNDDRKSEPPKKMMKFKTEDIQRSMSYEKSDDFKKFDYEFVESKDSIFIDSKYDYNSDKTRISSNINDDMNSSKSSQTMGTSFDSFLQEIFSWNPEWFEAFFIIFFL
jgi:hypothetical protein